MDTKLLLTPGPLTTSVSVKQTMLNDLGTRDGEYQTITKNLRKKLLQLAHAQEDTYTCVFMQGSGTFGVESVLTSAIKPNEKVLIIANGAYGERMKQICEKANVPHTYISYSMLEQLDLTTIEPFIADKTITHVAYVHCETTAGILNDIKGIQTLIHKYNKISIVDAMSSFASVPISMDEYDIDYLITSANKCLHGVPGLAIVFAKKQTLATCMDICPSLSLDLYAQYDYMEKQNSSFRFTSPTHVLLALNKAVDELCEYGGILARHNRYVKVQKAFYECMTQHGFKTLVDQRIQCPVITTYLIPDGFNFQAFYDFMKANGILLYAGKLPAYEAFRIGNIGEISDADIAKFKSLVTAYKEKHHEC